MTYEPGWLERRISDAAREYDTLPDSFKDALRLKTSPWQDSSSEELQASDNS